MIELQQVSRSIEVAGLKRKLLSNINLQILPGQTLAISGATGAGKTTLLQLLYGDQPPTEGKAWLFDHELARLRQASLRTLRRKIGVVPQDLRLIDERTAYDNIALALEIRQVPKAVLRTSAEQCVDDFGLSAVATVPVAYLSCGERQRVAIARALVTQPTVVLLDEPTAHLDDAGVRLLVDKLTELAKNRKAAAVIVTNDPRLLDAGEELAWRYARVHAGELHETAYRSSVPRVRKRAATAPSHSRPRATTQPWGVATAESDTNARQEANP